MTSADKDFRFMATNDLMSELQKDNIKLDDDSERKVVRMLLKVSQWDGTTVPERNQFNVTKNDFQLLEDKNGEVQNLAVRCLGPLVGKVKEYQVESIVDNLVCGARNPFKVESFSFSRGKKSWGLKSKN